MFAETSYRGVPQLRRIYLHGAKTRTARHTGWFQVGQSVLVIEAGVMLTDCHLDRQQEQRRSADGFVE